MAQTTTTTPVRCVNVTKFYAGVLALDNVSVDLRAGECVCLVGDNGAGKTTLVKILSGILSPDIGQVLIDGKPVGLNRQAARQHGLEAVYQDLALVIPARRGRERHARAGADPVQARPASASSIVQPPARSRSGRSVRSGSNSTIRPHPFDGFPAVNAKRSRSHGQPYAAIGW